MNPENSIRFKAWLREQSSELGDAEHSTEMKSRLVPMYKHNEAGLRTALRIYGMTASMIVREILKKYEELEKSENEKVEDYVGSDK